VPSDLTHHILEGGHLSRLRWYREASSLVRFLTWVLIILALLIIAGYILGTPSDAGTA